MTESDPPTQQPNLFRQFGLFIGWLSGATVGLAALLLAGTGVAAVPQFERGDGQQESPHRSDHGTGQVQNPPERRGRQYNR